MLERVIENGLLFDFYGKLLTEKQQQVILLYYYDDLSLGEIGERLDISRQGVYDHLHRSEELLHEYEQKLGLVSKYSKLKKELDNLTEYINDQGLDTVLKEEILTQIEAIKKHL